MTLSMTVMLIFLLLIDLLQVTEERGIQRNNSRPAGTSINPPSPREAETAEAQWGTGSNAAPMGAIPKLNK
jgi:hypothetical protein